MMTCDEVIATYKELIELYESYKKLHNKDALKLTMDMISIQDKIAVLEDKIFNLIMEKLS